MAVWWGRQWQGSVAVCDRRRQVKGGQACRCAVQVCSARCPPSFLLPSPPCHQVLEVAGPWLGGVLDRFGGGLKMT